MIGKVEADREGRREVLLAELGGQTKYLLVKCGMAWSWFALTWL